MLGKQFNISFLSIKHPTQLLTKMAKLRVNRLIGFPFSFIPVERQLKKLKIKGAKTMGTNVKRVFFSNLRRLRRKTKIMYVNRKKLKATLLL